jgi:hypothetical protein
LLRASSFVNGREIGNDAVEFSHSQSIPTEVSLTPFILTRLKPHRSLNFNFQGVPWRLCGIIPVMS